MLKKTTGPELSQKEKKKASEPSEVAAILMRRAAVEASESDQGIFQFILDEDEDDDGWD